MARISKKVEDRIKVVLKQFGPVLQAQRDRDVSEADTVTLVKDLLADLFGFDKYTELTGEYQVRSTFCDLAIRIEGKLRLLVEVKAIGMTLNDRHVRQAVDYAANQGLDYVALTNSIQWRLFRVEFKKPIEAHLVTEFDLLAVNPKRADDMERVHLLTKEGVLKGAIQEFTARKDATSRFMLAALLVNDDEVIALIRRQLRRLTELLVPPETIVDVLRNEVIKREALEGDQATDAGRLVHRKSRAGRSKAIAVPAGANPSGDTGGPDTPRDPSSPGSALD